MRGSLKEVLLYNPTPLAALEFHVTSVTWYARLVSTSASRRLRCGGGGGEGTPSLKFSAYASSI